MKKRSVMGCYTLSARYTLIQIIYAIWEGTNNYVELYSLKILLLFIVEKRCQKLQVFRYSMLVVNWINREQGCLHAPLLPLLEDIH